MLKKTQRYEAMCATYNRASIEPYQNSSFGPLFNIESKSHVMCATNNIVNEHQ